MTADEAMAAVEAALDSWLRGDTEQDKTLIAIAEVCGRYEGAK